MTVGSSGQDTHATRVRNGWELADPSNLLHLLLTCALIVAAVWVARFWYSAEFGLYEDDYARVPEGMAMSAPTLWAYVVGVFKKFGGQGRPFHDSFIYVFSYLGQHLDGLRGVYWFAFLIVSANAVLFFLLLRRIVSHPVVLLTASLAYALFPADTNQAYLTTALGSQTSLTFFLLASHFYLSEEGRPLSYLLIPLSLLCYETVFTVFFAAPFLAFEWNRTLRHRLAVHGGVLASMVIVITILRRLTGETYVSELDLGTILTAPIRQMVIGPSVSLAMYFYRPVDAMIRGDSAVLLSIGASLAVLAWLLFRVKLTQTGKAPFVFESFREWTRKPEVTEYFHSLGRLALVGWMMLVLAYPLTFTVPAYEITGRATRVHLAAAPGGSILFGCFCSCALYLASAYRKRVMASLVLAVLFGGMIGFGIRVQQSYRLAWRYQRAFWTDVVRLCPDLSERTFVVVERLKLRETEHIYAFGWSMPLILQQLYQFPAEWEHGPVTYGLLPDWREFVGAEGNLKAGVDLRQWKLVEVPDPDYVYLDAQGDSIIRPPGPLRAGKWEIPLKEASGSGPIPFPKKLLHAYLIQPDDEERVVYVAD